MSRASELEAARLAAERIDARCNALCVLIDTADLPRDLAGEILANAASQMLAEASYISEQRKSGWRSRSDAHTAAGRILEQWARDLAAYLECDKPPMRPPLDELPRNARADVDALDPADGPISAQITSGLMSQATDGPVTPDVARAIREAKDVDAKLDVAFGPVDPPTEQPAPVFAEDVTHITGAPANYAWCDATSGLRGYVGSANCPDCIAAWDAFCKAEDSQPVYDASVDRRVTLAPGEVHSDDRGIIATSPVIKTGQGPGVLVYNQTDAPVTVDWNAKGEATVSIPQFSEPGAPPPRHTQKRMTFVEIREHGMARARGADHRSYSQASSFAECGVRYALADLEPPAWWNVGGTAVHYACEWLNRETYKLNQSDPSVDAQPKITDVETLWINCLNRATSETIAESSISPDHWRAAKKGAEGYDWWRVNGVDMVRRWMTRLTWLYDQGWRIAEFNSVPAIEYDCPMWIGQIQVENIIDLALTRDDGTLLIVDAKSGASAPDSTAQLGQYAHALHRTRVPERGSSYRQWTGAIFGAYWLARADEMRFAGVPQNAGTAQHGEPVDLRELHPWSEIEYVITTMHAAESAGLYLPYRSPWCGSCGVKGLCPVGPQTPASVG